MCGGARGVLGWFDATFARWGGGPAMAVSRWGTFRLASNYRRVTTQDSKSPAGGDASTGGRNGGTHSGPSVSVSRSYCRGAKECRWLPKPRVS